MRFAALMLVLLASLGASAQPFVCGSSDSVTRDDQARALWSDARRASVASKGTPTGAISIRDHIAIVRADDFNAPFRNPIDLEGKSIHFRRLSSSAYAVSSGPLAFDANRGTLLTLDVNDVPNRRYGFTHFLFPFFHRDLGAVYVGANNALYIEPPEKAAAFRQYGDLELATDHTAMIAPMLITPAMQREIPRVWAKQDHSAITFTWVVEHGEAPYEVQAVLFAGGDIRFSYRNVRELRAGAAVVTSGSEPWRDQRELLGAGTDHIGTAPPMLDLRNVEVRRIGGLDLLEFRIELAEPIDRTKIGTQITYSVAVGSQVLSYTVRPDGRDEYTVPGWGKVMHSPAARIDSHYVYLYALQDSLLANRIETNVQVTAQGVPPLPMTDVVRMEVDFSRLGTRTRADLSAAAGASFEGRPIAEAFTLPAVSVYAVWDQLRAAYGLKPEDFAGVAVYQNFPTDIEFYADAYSTGGNAGADGVTLNPQAGRRFPLAPALMHMNRIGYGRNKTDRSAAHIVMHELGHHWLHSIAIAEEAGPSTVLNPVSSHPAQYVDTRVAFPVLGDNETSVMGGGAFQERGGGMFVTPMSQPYGFTWLDLYLMGLADAREVPPWFYVSNASPPLGTQYYPPPLETFRGTRRAVSIDQVTAVMGPRNPPYPHAPHNFRVLFVLLATPERDVTEEELASMTMYRRLLTDRFRLATAGRGEVMTTFTPGVKPRPRAFR